MVGAGTVILCVAILTGHSYLGQQKPPMISSLQPGIGGGQLCCKQMISPRKQKQKSHGFSLGICCAETYTLPSKRHAPGPILSKSSLLK